MNVIKKSMIALALLAFTVPAEAAKNKNKNSLKKQLQSAQSKLAAATKAAKKAVEDKLAPDKTFMQKHNTAVKVGACGFVTAAVAGALYKYNQKFKNAVNAGCTKAKDAANFYVVEPVSKMSRNAKIATAATAVTSVAAYFGYKKFKAAKGKKV